MFDSAEDWIPVDQLRPFDVQALRLILTGGSVVDLKSVGFADRTEVDRFLRLLRFDPDSPGDTAWMRGLLDDAAKYLRESLRLRVPSEVADPDQIPDVLLLASGAGGRQLQRIACIALKICHVIFHVEARDLFHRLPMSEEAFGEMAERQVMEVFTRMMAAGFPIREASASAKSRESTISKLLQKVDTVASTIYDRTRFRVVVESQRDVLPLLHSLTRRLFPFHVVVPGQTHNSLIDFEDVRAAPPKNNSSGATYRMLKFVVDLPLRIPEELIARAMPSTTRARTVCSLVEIQIVDAATARENDHGENEHERYKRRQKIRVLRRLSRGT